MLKVIALGNTLRGDDGIGPAVIDALQAKAVPRIQCISLGSDSFGLLEHLRQSVPILLIDCATMGFTPGQIRSFDVEHAEPERLDGLISLHGYSFSEIYRLAAGLGSVAPCRCIGVEPAAVRYGESLSPEVRAAIPAVIQMVFEEMQRYEEENTHHR